MTRCTAESAIAYLDRIAACNNADLSRFVPWRIDAWKAGFVRNDRAPRLLAARHAFLQGDDGTIRLRGDDVAARTSALAEFGRSLANEGAIRLREEPFPVTARIDEAPRCAVDRGAVPWLGVRPFGVHVAGYSRSGGELFAWVAVRSASKSFPGAWDNTVAGGQPTGLTLLDNVIKECAEEASIPRDLAARAMPTEAITYVREDDTGLKPDTLFCYDLELPPDFEPQPCDGEVERFLRLPARELARVVRDEARCKPNCSLVWIGFLLRHGILDEELRPSERDELQRRLRAPLP